MKISDVLLVKGSHIETIDSSKAVYEIVEILRSRNISSVVVVDDEEKSLGIVTDRIIINALAQHGKKALLLSAIVIMYAPVPLCLLDDSITHAMRIMTNRRVRHLLVMEGERAYGIVSIGDLVKCRIRDVELENSVLRDMAVGYLTSGEAHA